mgnify:CR=1 FL=1
MVTFETDGEQGLFEMVHAKTLIPNPKPVMLVVGESELVIVPLPETKVQTPVPTAGKFAFIFAIGEEIQSVWLEPAFAIVGT